MGFEDAEFFNNPEPRCPCILLLDTSGSMGGAPIDALNEGLQLFKANVCEDSLASKRVETSIITFGGTVQMMQDFITADSFSPPTLSANGGTPMGEAINLALDKLRERKNQYKAAGVDYYRPWIFLITDGAPTDDWQPAAQRVRQEEDAKAVAFFAVGVQGADMSTLGQISVRQPVMLHGLNFGEMFKWLSASMTSISQSKIGEETQLPPLGWGSA